MVFCHEMFMTKIFQNQMLIAYLKNLGASVVSFCYATDSPNLKLHNHYCYSAQQLVGQGGPKKLFLDFQKLLDAYDFELSSNTCYLITNDIY